MATLKRQSSKAFQEDGWERPRLDPFDRTDGNRESFWRSQVTKWVKTQQSHQACSFIGFLIARSWAFVIGADDLFWWLLVVSNRFGRFEVHHNKWISMQKAGKPTFDCCKANWADSAFWIVLISTSGACIHHFRNVWTGRGMLQGLKPWTLSLARAQARKRALARPSYMKSTVFDRLLAPKLTEDQLSVLIHASRDAKDKIAR